MKRSTLIFMMGMCAGLGGCFPVKLIVWSPDGQRAAVNIEGRLYLCDADGKLSPPVAEEVLVATWFPDSRHLGMIKASPAKRWDQIAAVISPDARKRLTDHAEKLRAQVLAGEDWEAQVRPLLDAGTLSSNEIDAIKIYLHDRHWGQLKEKLRTKWDKLNEPSLCSLVIFRVGDQSIQPTAELAGSLLPITEVRVSPDGHMVAFVEGDNLFEASKTITRLFAVPADGGAPARIVDDHVALFPDWGASGTDLVYAKAMKPLPEDSDFRLGTVLRRQVRDETGQMLETFPEPDILAGLVFSSLSKIRCLPDGRILFSSAEFHLPTTAQDMPQRQQLFALDPQRQATITRLVPRAAVGTLGDRVDFFEVSPDATKVAVPSSDGRVTVLTLASGTVEIVQKHEDPDREGHRKLRTLPVWKSADELCFLIPAKGPKGEDGRPEFVLWSAGQTRSLSKDWPDELLSSLMPDPKPMPAPPL